MRPIFIALFCIGCSDPFSVDRHDLVDPRIIGVRKTSEGYVAQVWNGNAAFHAEEPKLIWFDEAGIEVGTGVVLSETDLSPVMVEYEDSFGAIHQAEFETQEAEEFFTISMQAMTDTVSYTLHDRQEQLGSDILNGISTEHTRLIANVDDSQQLRWTTAQGIGSFLELNRSSTDFYWKDIVLDRDEVEKDEAISEQYATIFALSIDQEGRNQWQWVDLWRETGEEISLLRHQNRYFPIALDIEEETDILVTLEQEDSLFGFQFTNPQLITEELEELPEPLSCALHEDSFEWWWIEVGICTQDDVIGKRIQLQVAP